MKYRYIYKITCLLGEWKGMYYIGQHTTSNMNDGYAGSGVRISEYYSIYGKRLGYTYKIRILKQNIKSQKDLDKYEKLYINKYLGKDKCLNMCEGGLHYNNDLDKFHVIETDEEGNYRSCEKIDDNIVLYSNIHKVPIYQSKCGKLHSKAIDLQKQGINFY